MHNKSNPEADGLKQQKTTPVPLLSDKNRTQRIQFTQAHQNWTIEDCKNVVWSDESRFLLQHSDGRVRIWCKEHESMDPSCLVSTVQAGGGGVMVWRIFSWHTLCPLVPIEHRLNATAYLSIVVDHVHPFMTTVYPSSDGYFQQDNAPCHKDHIISDWFREHDNEFTLLKWDELIHNKILSRTTVTSCSHSTLSVNKWLKGNWHYFFEKVTQIFSCKLKMNALLY